MLHKEIFYNTPEESSEGEGDSDLSIQNIITNSFNDFLPLIIGIIISLLLAIIIIIKRKIIKKWYIYLIPLYVILASYILFRIIHSPNPKKAYMISLLFDYDYGIKSDFKHKSGKKGWTFTASAMININGKQHIFVGGGDKQDDALLLYNKKNKEFDNVINKTNLSASTNSFSAVSIDMNKDGNEDLLVGRRDGVYFYKSLGGYNFEMKKIVDKKDKVPLAIAVSDYNRDGTPDIYLSYFTPMHKYRGTVFNDLSHGRKNILLEGIKTKNNASSIKFKDVTNNKNASGMKYNTFTSAFVDLNNDNWPDIVLAHDSGEVEILENKKGHFKSHFPSELKGNYMGLAIGDYDGDGDQDIFVTNIGEDTSRNKLSLGDIKNGQKQTFKHLLLRNDGDFKFVEESKECGISGEGFGWGAIMTDPDLDGDLDLFFAENTFIFPKHYIAPNPSHFYRYNGNNNKFKREFKYRNPYFGQTPISGDIDGDKLNDIIWINMEGPVIAHIGGKINNNYLIVELPKNAIFANARIVVDSGTKKFYRENIIGGVGFGGDGNDGRIVIGLGEIDKIKSVNIFLVNGKEFTVKNPKVNSIIKAK